MNYPRSLYIISASVIFAGAGCIMAGATPALAAAGMVILTPKLIVGSMATLGACVAYLDPEYRRA